MDIKNKLIVGEISGKEIINLLSSIDFSKLAKKEQDKYSQQ